MKLNAMKWGEDSAENDPLILDYFVTSDTLSRLVRGDKQIIVGRKGAGKSAVRKKIESLFNEKQKTFVASITPTLQAVRSITTDTDIAKNFGQEIFFQYIWLRHILTSCLVESGREASIIKDISGSKAFARDLAESLGQSNNGLIETVRDLVTRIKVSAGSLGELGLSAEKKLRDITDVASLEHHLSQLARNGERFVACVDDLDLGWNNTPVTNAFLLGLFSAALSLRSRIPEMAVYMFVREDVYNILVEQTQHSDKYRNIELLRWTQDKLKEVLCERIRYNVEQTGAFEPEDPFGVVFPATIGTSNTDNWLMERTLLRPRELIQLCRLYTESVDGNSPDADKLKEAEKQYSEWKLEDIANEFTHQYPGLRKLFSLFKTKLFRKKYHLSKNEVTGILEVVVKECAISEDWWVEIASDPRGDVSPLLHILYEIGFIGDYLSGGQGGSRTVYSFDSQHEPRFEEIQIHPCFRKAIGTVERIRT